MDTLRRSTVDRRQEVQDDRMENQGLRGKSQNRVNRDSHLFSRSPGSGRQTFYDGYKGPKPHPPTPMLLSLTAWCLNFGAIVRSTNKESLGLQSGSGGDT